MPDFPLQTERLILRPLEMDDWRAVHVYASDPLVVRYMPWGPNTEEDTQSFIQGTLDAWQQTPQTAFELAVILRAEGRLIGGGGVRICSSEHSEGVIGYCYGRDTWGNGYAPEAARALLALGFGPLGLHRVFADCDVENTASARVLEKIGMQREGRLRENAWYKGRWRDSLRYSILEHEWRKGD